MSNVTLLLSAIEAGDPKAADQLLPLVYEELRKLAAARMALEKPGQTLQATELVHDHRNESRGDRSSAANLPPDGRAPLGVRPFVAPSGIEEKCFESLMGFPEKRRTEE